MGLRVEKGDIGGCELGKIDGGSLLSHHICEGNDNAHLIYNYPAMY